MIRLVVLALIACISLSAPPPAHSATLRGGFRETVVAFGLSRPTAMAFAPDGRLFVAQQTGELRVIKDGGLLPAPFLKVTVDSQRERGLLGVAFDPDFATTQYVYVYYTATTPDVHNRLSRFTADGDVAVPGSEVAILDLPTLNDPIHNGGAIHFGPDGLLYVAVGENGVWKNAQTLENPLGKILRINRDGSIPATNPFFGQTSGISRAIWAFGLRNPFTFAFEEGTGRMMINDVGQATWEEINEGVAGGNYGWPIIEGPVNAAGLMGPIYAYNHGLGACAISGGAFYPLLPSQFPAAYAGDYFFADFCGGWIRRFDFRTGIDSVDFASGIPFPVDLTIGPEGALYYLARGGGDGGLVVRIDAVGPGESTGEPVGQPPRPRILTPSARMRYTGGALLEFSGAASDREDGVLPPSAFTWQIFFYNGSELVPVSEASSGSTRGAYRIPDTGIDSVETWYRVQLTVTDADSNRVTTFRDVQPRVARVTLASTPAGLTLSVDGRSVATPTTFRSVVGMRRTISAAPSQISSGTTYVFRGWSDRGARTHTMAVTGDVTLRALYGRQRGGTPTSPPRPAVPRGGS